MAVLSINSGAVLHSGKGTSLARAFARIDAIFTEIAKARATTREYEALADLTDAQLAERGLTRSQLVRYAARAYL